MEGTGDYLRQPLAEEASSGFSYILDYCFSTFFVSTFWVALVIELSCAPGGISNLLRRVQLYLILAAIFALFAFLILSPGGIFEKPSRLVAISVLEAHSDIVEVQATRPVQQSSLITDRIQQLNDRTQVCTRQEWEDFYMPLLHNGQELSLTSCSICLADIAMDAKVRGLSCGHIFHLPCVGEWFMKDQTFELCCPLCRVPLCEQKLMPERSSQ
mmetsp:Transcript_32498/g.51924  ORF Transcript_32498/g.51924 Transcript_32498/m.51924 type:complete len:214 (-) Transcript_32498:27-668(-)